MDKIKVYETGEKVKRIANDREESIRRVKEDKKRSRKDREKEREKTYRASKGEG